MKTNALIPTRFLLLISHLVVTVILFSSIEANIRSCLPENSLVDDKRQEYTVGLSVMLALIGIELIGFISGITMFMPTQDVISIIAHSSASISLSYFIFEAWPCEWFWWIFCFCSVIPAFTEILAILSFILSWNV